MEKVHNTVSMKRAIKLFGATLALGGFMALSTPVEAHASEWDERAVTEIQTDIQNTDSIKYEIQWGDTLGNIAQALGMSVESLASSNGIENMNYIIAGQTLVISEDAEGNTQVEVQAEPVQEVQAEPVQEVEPEPVVEVAPEPVAEPVQEVQAEAPAPESNLSTSEAEAKEIIAQRESGGSYTAVNGQYYGRYQLNPSLVHHGASPAEQEAAVSKYLDERYGGSWNTALEFWNANGWY